MKADREIVLSEEEIQNICNDFGKRFKTFVKILVKD